MGLQLQYATGMLEAGCDEAGRGCLAGPVVAAAVILPSNFKNKLLNDSKQLSEKKRNALRPIIEEQAIAWAIGICTEREIEKFNILQASIMAMHRALAGLKTIPEHIIIDGNRFKPYHTIHFKTIVKGDSKYSNIAAASVLAKTYRDDMMQNLHAQFPMYAWDKNMGYPTSKHRDAIRLHGACLHHRKTFRLLPEQLKLF